MPAPVAGAAGGAAASSGLAALQVVAALGRIAASVIGAEHDPEVLLGSATRAIREGAGLLQVSAWRLRGDRLFPVGVSGPPNARLTDLPRGFGVLGAALATPGTVVDIDLAAALSATALNGREIAAVIPGGDGPWGVVLAVTETLAAPEPATRELVGVAASVLATIIDGANAAANVAHQLHRAEALRRVAGDIGSGLDLDLDQILAGLVDHATVLFGGERAAVFLYEADGSRRASASKGLSATYLATHQPSLTASAIAAGTPKFATSYREDPQGAEDRAAVVQEGFDTICIAPLFDAEGAPLGTLNVYHDRPHHWSEDELETIDALATQAAVAIRTARTYAQLATWAAQLQSIQQLGARLSRLGSVEDIGTSIATELRQLIDYHNVRVYRIAGDDLVPVAMQGQVGEYVDETPEQLRIKIGGGITGWVAQHRIAQVLHDAAADPRANTIPGTEDDLDESMLLAPMLYEDEVLGVLVLSKLGLNQFREDDLRLLVIYASFAAQAMANADNTARLREQSAALERQVRSRRDLLQITESILTSLDVREVLDAVADRLGELVGWDNIAIELAQPGTALLVPVVAKGADAEFYMQPWEEGETGLATWVLEHNEAALIVDEFDDPRIRHSGNGPTHGSIICVPLRGRGRATGILTVERIGVDRTFTDEEFELVKLFAAQVSIALQNAQAHGALARRAETDDLTGLRNHGSFRGRLESAVELDDPFSVLMIDLDRFKLVNDTFGHPAGNDLLKRMADAIVAASRDNDAVYRYGGDEFAVILAGTDATSVGPV
ncbi:MAG: GAF domain-containing protein, partial [Candidatus Limnocylindrales bacterium]